MPNCSVALPPVNELLEKTRLISKQAQKITVNKKRLKKDYRIKLNLQTSLKEKIRRQE